MSFDREKALKVAQAKHEEAETRREAESRAKAEAEHQRQAQARKRLEEIKKAVMPELKAMEQFLKDRKPPYSDPKLMPPRDYASTFSATLSWRALTGTHDVERRELRVLDAEGHLKINDQRTRENDPSEVQAELWAAFNKLIG